LLQGPVQFSFQFSLRSVVLIFGPGTDSISLLILLFLFLLGRRLQKSGLTEVTTDHRLRPVPGGSGLGIWLGLGS